MMKVSINQGVLAGSNCVTENGSKYVEFLQIPYAKPPIGNLRFKGPQAPEPWLGERHITSVNEDNVGFQLDLLTQKCKGGEDCLYLNVYTPKLPSSTDKKLLPVMVYIHGGGFVCGNGIIKKEGGPDYMIDQDVVVVAINYRLGIFGFLSFDIPEASGNMGLKDQVMALKWVQNNIAAFGGDKDNVTLFGISAGGASIEYLILSPLAKGLFHKAIPQSGSTLNHWAINYEIPKLSLNVAHGLGYQGDDKDAFSVYEFLVNQPMAALGSEAIKHSNFTEIKRTFFGFVPTIEKDFGNGEAFLTEYPYNLLKEGRFNKVPVLRGFCENEGILVLGFKPQQVKDLCENKRFVDYWSYPITSININALNDDFKKVYNSENNDTDDCAVDFFGDFDFTSGIWISSKLLANNGVPLYVYMFAYDGNMNFLKVLSKISRKGTSHGDDSGYTLKIELPGILKPNKTDIMIKDRISKMWTNFAKSGNPVPSTNELIPVKWPTFTSTDQKYLVIDKEVQVRDAYEPKRMAVFEDIYEKCRK